MYPFSDIVSLASLAGTHGAPFGDLLITSVPLMIVLPYAHSTFVRCALGHENLLFCNYAAADLVSTTRVSDGYFF